MHKIPVDLLCDKFGSLFLLKDYIKNVISTKIAGFAQESFNAFIVQKWTIYEFSLQIKPPSGKGPGTLFYIFFGVISTTHGKEFHYLPGEVFIGMFFSFLLIIKKRKHGRAFTNLL